MRKSLVGAIVLALLVVLAPVALAQGGATSSITGIVKDEGGGVLPGVNVVVASGDDDLRPARQRGNAVQPITSTA